MDSNFDKILQNSLEDLHSIFFLPKWRIILRFSGRTKIKKIALPLIAAAGVKLFALIPIVLGSLGLLVMKALFVGKIALLLAGVLAFQRLFGSGNGATSFFNKNNQPSTGWVDNGGGQGWSSGNVASNVQPQGYYRSFNDQETDAHSMAYSAQAPITNETNWNSGRMKNIAKCLNEEESVGGHISRVWCV